ncbi:MAG: hypothetical protein ACFHWX_14260 [Bacteroidota bacterium]
MMDQPKFCRIFLSLLFYSISFLAFSQSDFKEGFYISNENDTIRGLIEDRSGTANFLSCTFKEQKSSKQIKLQPEEIMSYQFDDGRLFLSKEIYVDSVKRTAFVEFLVDGISDLYFYRDPDHYFYIIESEKGQVIELQEQKITELDVAKKDFDPFWHVRKLKVAFADCMEIQPQVEQASFTHKSLIKLTKDYHNYVCDDYECIVYEKSLGPPKIYFSPLIGVSASNIKFVDSFYSGFNFDQNMNAAFGGEIEAVLALINSRISVQLDVLFRKNNYHGNYNGYYDLYINNNLMQYSLLFKYRFLSGIIRPSLGVGFSANTLNNLSYRAIIENIPGQPSETEITDIHMKSGMAGGVIQLGINYRVFKDRELFTNFRYTFSQNHASIGQNQGSSEASLVNFNTYSAVFGFYLNKIK